MPVSLQAVDQHRLDLLARLHALCFPEDGWDAQALANILAMPGAAGRVAAEDRDGPVGLVLDLILGEDAEILTLGVHPERRRQGIGRLLLEDVFGRARLGGARAVVLEVAADNPAALALYETCGFRTVGQRRGYYQRERSLAVDAWLLRRSLAG